VIIDQQSAHERIVYERCLNKMKSGVSSSQKSLFPETFTLKAKEGEILKSILPQLLLIGLDIEKFGIESYVIQGLPVGSNISGKQMIENLIEDFSLHHTSDLGIEESLAASFAKQTCIKRTKQLTKEEMLILIDDLFACEMPYASPSGHKCFVTVNGEEIKNYFN
jgi:DNA mismatch repair protein MutL